MVVKITSDTARNNTTITGFISEAKRKAIEINRLGYQRYKNDKSVEGKKMLVHYAKALASIVRNKE